MEAKKKRPGAGNTRGAKGLPWTGKSNSITDINEAHRLARGHADCHRYAGTACDMYRRAAR